MSRWTQSHHLNKLGSTQAPDAAYHVSRSSVFWFQRRRFFKVFTIYGHNGHLGHVTWTVWTKFRYPIPRRMHMKFGFNQPIGFRGDVWKCWCTTYNGGLPILWAHQCAFGSGELNIGWEPNLLTTWECKKSSLGYLFKPTCAVYLDSAVQNSCQPRITPLDRAIMVNVN